MTTQATKRLTLDDVLVIDVDVHAHDTPEELAPYSDPQWRPVLENLGRAAHRYLDLPGYSSFASPKLPGTGVPPPRGDSRIDIVWNAEQMRSELDEFSIDVGILFPDHLLRLAGLPNIAYAGALARAYHRWLKEKWLGDNNDLYGVIVATPQDPEESAREIERWARDERFVGVFLPCSLVYPLWGHGK